MKISSKARYSLFIMAELALQYNKKLVQVKAFSLQKGLSSKYLEQIIIGLRSAGLIDSVRGSYGGYRLSKDPSDISLYTIFMATQSQVNYQNCYNQKSELHCPSANRCLTVHLWSLLDHSVRSVMEKTSLLEFIQSVPNFQEYKCEIVS